jgi:hypothetical protein
MQKNDIKSCCQAEGNEKQQEKGEEHLAQDHENAFITFPAFLCPFSGLFFLIGFYWHSFVKEKEKCCCG